MRPAHFQICRQCFMNQDGQPPPATLATNTKPKTHVSIPAWRLWMVQLNRFRGEMQCEWQGIAIASSREDAVEEIIKAYRNGFKEETPEEVELVRETIHKNLLVCHSNSFIQIMRVQQNSTSSSSLPLS